MYSKVVSGALEGINGKMVEVEADLSNGLPVFDMVGYLASEVKEARERVRAAMRNQGYSFPPKRITVNLSPADMRKSGSLYDLPVAMAVLLAGGYLPPLPEAVLFLGELGLDGSLKRVRGVLPLVLGAKEEGIRVCVVPKENRREASIVEGVHCIGCASLRETVDFFLEWEREGRKEDFLEEQAKRQASLGEKEREEKEAFWGAGLDFQDIKGQALPRRAIEIAVSGHHNLLMTGPPGSGKTALAQRIPTIMPSLTPEESLELSKLYSISGLLSEHGGLVTRRPFRAPHHTISTAAMAGGGRCAMPGEISLADKGVLFLDELPEYDRRILEILRQPLEDGRVVVARSQRKCTYPADFTLVAAMNPCPCGFYPDRKKCFCTRSQLRRYRGKVSGPLLDRIDLAVRVNPVSYGELREKGKSETSSAIRKRVEKTRQLQTMRYAGEGYCYNSRMDQKGLEKYCPMTGDCERELQKLFSRYEMSGRGYTRLLKLARTIADMDGAEKIAEGHLGEAAVFRMGWEEERGL